jgi:phage repressor protein C with HTH and peptisase S24 domain
MLPTYKPGDTLLAWKWFTPAVGQAVIAWQGRTVVKRVARVVGQDVWLEGDNSAKSTDSRSLGPIKIDQLEAKVILRLG